MFVLVHNNFVEFGPVYWNKAKFETILREDLEIVHELPSSWSTGVYTVDSQTKIYPIMAGDDLPHNPRIEIRNGPFWEFTDSIAIYHYEPMRMELESAKNLLKTEVSNERWKKEVSGFKTTIQNLEVSIDTQRGTRETFIQKYLLLADSDTVNWKFPERWLTLTKGELQSVVNQINAHVQTAFDWESSLISQITACQTHDDLLLVQLTN